MTPSQGRKSPSSGSESRVRFNERVTVIPPEDRKAAQESQEDQKKSGSEEKGEPWKKKKKRKDWFRRKYPTEALKGGEADQKRSEGSQPNSSEFGEGSEDSEVNEEEVESALNGFRRWLKENPMDGLTTVQCGAHLMLQILKSGTSFGKYLRRMLEPHEETRQERQRSVLPLPLKDDSWKEMKKVRDSGEFKRLAGTWKEKQALGASKTKKEMRKVGLLIWHGLVTASLNFLWSGGRTLGQIAQGTPSKAQVMCQERLWESVKVFVDDVSETAEKLVKAPDSGDWNQRLEKMRISYHGEVVEKSQSLTLEQILPGLPPPWFWRKGPIGGALRRRGEAVVASSGGGLAGGPRPSGGIPKAPSDGRHRRMGKDWSRTLPARSGQAGKRMCKAGRSEDTERGVWCGEAKQDDSKRERSAATHHGLQGLQRCYKNNRRRRQDFGVSTSSSACSYAFRFSAENFS